MNDSLRQHEVWVDRKWLQSRLSSQSQNGHVKRRNLDDATDNEDDTLSDDHPLQVSYVKGFIDHVALDDKDASGSPGFIMTINCGEQSFEIDLADWLPVPVNQGGQDALSSRIITLLSEGLQESSRRTVLALASSCSNKHDITGMDIINEPNVLAAMRETFSDGHVYVNFGRSMVSINPFKDTSIFDDATVHRFIEPLVHHGSVGSRASKPSTETHLYNILVDALTAQGDQSVIFTGESGTGKSFTLRKAVHFLLKAGEATASPHFHVEPDHMGGHVQPEAQRAQETTTSAGPMFDKVIRALRIIEYLGNAPTPLNHNSSRVGIKLSLHYGYYSTQPESTTRPHIDDTPGRDEKMTLLDTEFTTYLLERSRVASWKPDEGSFHILGLIRQEFENGHEGPERVSTVPPSMVRSAGLRDAGPPEFSLSDFRDNLAWAGFTVERIESYIRILRGVVCLILSHSDPVGQRVSRLDDTPSRWMARASTYFGLSSETLERVLKDGTRRIGGGGGINGGASVMSTGPLDEQTIKANAASLGMWMYALVVEDILDSLNSAGSPMSATGSTSPSALMNGQEGGNRTILKTISFIDIYGFEKMKENGFEQLCINFTNERLQCFYNRDHLETSRTLHKNFKRYTGRTGGGSHTDSPSSSPRSAETSLSNVIRDAEAVLSVFSGPGGIIPCLNDITKRSILSAAAPKPPDRSALTTPAATPSTSTRLIDQLRANLATSKGTRTATLDGRLPAPAPPFKVLADGRFTIRHYARSVTYTSADLPEKNRCAIPPNIVSAGFHSTCSTFDRLIGKLQSGHQLHRAPPVGHGLGHGPGDVPPPPPPPAAAAGKVRKRQTSQFETLSQSLSSLETQLSNSTMRYMLCIRPNMVAKPDQWSDRAVLRQLRAVGGRQLLEMSRGGLICHLPFDEVVAREVVLAGGNRTAVRSLLDKLELVEGVDYEMGEESILCTKRAQWLIREFKEHQRREQDKEKERERERKVTMSNPMQKQTQASIQDELAERLVNSKADRGGSPEECQSRFGSTHNQAQAATRLRQAFLLLDDEQASDSLDSDHHSGHGGSHVDPDDSFGFAFDVGDDTIIIDDMGDAEAAGILSATTMGQPGYVMDQGEIDTMWYTVNQLVQYHSTTELCWQSMVPWLLASCVVAATASASAAAADHGTIRSNSAASASIPPDLAADPVTCPPLESERVLEAIKELIQGLHLRVSTLRPQPLADGHGNEPPGLTKKQRHFVAVILSNMIALTRLALHPMTTSGGQREQLISSLSSSPAPAPKSNPDSTPTSLAATLGLVLADSTSEVLLRLLLSHTTPILQDSIPESPWQDRRQFQDALSRCINRARHVVREKMGHILSAAGLPVQRSTLGPSGDNTCSPEAPGGTVLVHAAMAICLVQWCVRLREMVRQPRPMILGKTTASFVDSVLRVVQACRQAPGMHLVNSRDGPLDIYRLLGVDRVTRMPVTATSAGASGHTHARAWGDDDHGGARVGEEDAPGDIMSRICREAFDEFVKGLDVSTRASAPRPRALPLDQDTTHQDDDREDQLWLQISATEMPPTSQLGDVQLAKAQDGRFWAGMDMLRRVVESVTGPGDRGHWNTGRSRGSRAE